MEAKKFTQEKIPQRKEEYLTERQVRELVASILANYSGVVRFRSTELETLIISDFTDAQHAHTGTSSGGQLTDAALSSAVTVPKGGTGKTSVTSGSYLVGAGAGAMTEQAPPFPVAHGGTGKTSITSGTILKGNGTGAIAEITPLAGTKTCYVATVSGGSPTTLITFTDGILTGGL